jgi:SAM-dependent methyltransferase
MIERIRSILDLPYFYELYHGLIGANYRSRVLVNEYIRPNLSDRILDIGCGPGTMMPFLPECNYLGVDANMSYIVSARERYGHRGKFLCGRVNQQNVSDLGTFDIVLALGLVHHLEDPEARHLFSLGYTALKPGGRLITNDGCYTANQSVVERYLLSRDRGQYVRGEDEYLKLAHSSFDNVESVLRRDILRIPYTHIVMKCVR